MGLSWPSVVTSMSRSYAGYRNMSTNWLAEVAGS